MSQENPELESNLTLENSRIALPSNHPMNWLVEVSSKILENQPAGKQITNEEIRDWFEPPLDPYIAKRLLGHLCLRGELNANHHEESTEYFVTEKTNKTIETKETTEESPLVLTKNQHATLSLILKKLGPESIFNLDLLGFHLNRIMGPITLSTTVKALVKLGVLVQVEVGSNEFAFVLNPNLNPDIKFSLKVNSSKASESNKTHPASPTPKDNDEHGDKAACEGMDQVIFFPEKGASTKEAKKICQGCNIRIKCLDYAIENNINNGFWGGMSERERRRLRIKRAQET